jgi:hypothetical protein
VDDDFFIIQFLSIYLADMARAWLDHLRRHSIDCWEDLKEIITGNFQGTLSQKQGESLWDYIRCFSQKCHELPKICDGDFILAFWFKMNCQTLVNELGRDQPKTMKELLNNATRAMGKQALVMVEGRHSERLARALRGEPMVTIGAPKMMGGGGQSGNPNKSWLLLALMRVTMTRRPVTPMRSTSLLLSAISSTRHGSSSITLRSLLRQPTPSMCTPPSTS